MQSRDRRLLQVQHLAHEIMDEMNFGAEQKPCESLKNVIDNLSRIIGHLADPSGNYSLDYIEEKLGNAHYLVFENKKKIPFHQ